MTQENDTSQTATQNNTLAPDAIIVVRLPNGSDVPVPDLPLDAPAEDVLHLLQGTSDNPALWLAKIEAERVDQSGNRVIVLQTDAKQKGSFHHVV